jgi:hypothetical protein
MQDKLRTLVVDLRWCGQFADECAATWPFPRISSSHRISGHVSWHREPGGEGCKIRQGIVWRGVIVALWALTGSHVVDAQESDPVAVTKSFLGAWATSSVDDLMKFMADDAVVVGSSGVRLTGEQGLRRVLGALKGLQNRDYEVRTATK